jgi:hypothetical protein
MCKINDFNATMLQDPAPGGSQWDTGRTKILDGSNSTIL